MNPSDDFIKIEVLNEPVKKSDLVEGALARKRFITKSLGANLGIELRDGNKYFRVSFSGLDSPGSQSIDKKACLELAEFFRQAAEYVK